MGKDHDMDNLENQLNELLAQSDRVSAELKREIYLVERADAAIRYLRAAREKTAHEVAGLLAARAGEEPDFPHAKAVQDVRTSQDTPSSTPAPAPGDGDDINWPRVIARRS